MGKPLTVSCLGMYFCYDTCRDCQKETTTMLSFTNGSVCATCMVQTQFFFEMSVEVKMHVMDAYAAAKVSIDKLRSGAFVVVEQADEPLRSEASLRRLLRTLPYTVKMAIARMPGDTGGSDGQS